MNTCKKIENAKLFGDGKLKFMQSDDAITISVDERYRQAIDTIVEFEVEGQASEILPLDPL